MEITAKSEKMLKFPFCTRRDAGFPMTNPSVVNTQKDPDDIDMTFRSQIFYVLLDKTRQCLSVHNYRHLLIWT